MALNLFCDETLHINIGLYIVHSIRQIVSEYMYKGEHQLTVNTKVVFSVLIDVFSVICLYHCSGKYISDNKEV